MYSIVANITGLINSRHTDIYGLPLITLVAPMDYWLCVSVSPSVSVFSRERRNVQMLRASLC